MISLTEGETTIHIVYPLLRGGRRFKIERGRRWSVVEHLLLRALVDEPCSIDALCELSNLKRRVIIEACTRLMRAGWIEIRPSKSEIAFVATASGKRNSNLDNLPSITIPDARWITYYIDDVAGCVFRWRDVVNRSKKDLPKTTVDQYVHVIQRSGAMEDLSEVCRVLAGNDEIIVGAYPSAAGLSATFGVVTYRNGIPEGLPKGASEEFLKVLSDAYAEARVQVIQRGARAPAEVIVKRGGDGAFDRRATTGIFDGGDLLLNDKAHRDVFENVMGNAQDRVIIHSTFITDNAKQRVPKILHAASREVRVDIFFGQNSDSESKESSSQAAMNLVREWISGSAYREFIRLHHTSTGSHAKFLVSNDKRLGWNAVVGSCNWLATGFDSFEASIRIRDRSLVAELVNSLSMMSVGRKGIWSDTAQELANLSRVIALSPEKTGRRVPMKLLYTRDHADTPIEARDRCQRRAFVTSHRLGQSGKALALFPLIAAVSADSSGKKELFAYYGRATGPLTGIEASEIAREFAAAGLALKPVHRPRLHAKVLGWDSDCLAVSSFNWLSVDPNEKKPFNEIGVLVESTRLADVFLDVFESAQWT